MALMGAEALLYPTAIGSEPATGYESKDHWQTVMRGHAGANLMPIMAANRIGVERVGPGELTSTAPPSSPARTARSSPRRAATRKR